MIVKIHHQSQKPEQYAYSQKQLKLYLGRKNVDNLDEGEECIVVNQPTASRKHLLIKFKKNKIYVKDLESSNGTKINGETLEPNCLYQITPNDQITIGQSTSIIRAELRQKQSQEQDSSSESEKVRFRSREKKNELTFKISESTLKMLKQMTSDKKTKEERVKFLKLMGCKNVDEEWEEIQKYLKKGNRFPTAGKKTNEDLEKQFSAGRAGTQKSGLGSSMKTKIK